MLTSVSTRLLFMLECTRKLEHAHTSPIHDAFESFVLTPRLQASAKYNGKLPNSRTSSTEAGSSCFDCDPAMEHAGHISSIFPDFTIPDSKAQGQRAAGVSGIGAQDEYPGCCACPAYRRARWQSHRRKRTGRQSGPGGCSVASSPQVEV